MTTTIRAALTALLLIAALPATAAAAKVPGDKNRDGLPDSWAKKHKVLGKKQSSKDQDRDGLTNWAEWRAATDPRKADSDRDGVADGDEDRDRDGLDNGSEVDAKTDPGSADSDRDGKRDAKEDPDRDRLVNGDEDRTGNDPRDRDTDDDGVLDGDENAGTVVAVDGATGMVTIKLTNGKLVRGAMLGIPDLHCGDEQEVEELRPTPALTADPEEFAGEEVDADESLEDQPLSFRQAPGEGEEVADEDVDGADGDFTWETLDEEADDLAADDVPAELAACLAALKVGAIVHDARIVTDADGPILVAISLVTKS